MRKALAVVVAVAMAAVVAPGVAAAGTPTAMRWGACPADAAKPGLECASLAVPLDYQHPNGKQIGIEISRLKSTNQGRRRGVLLTNPGGPGLMGLTYPVELTDPVWQLPNAVRDAYDMIGFDPRGVGHSTPVTCSLSTEQVTKGNFPVYAKTPADVVAEAGWAKTVAHQCATSNTAWMLPHITTANTARDMDRIREALGAPKISYLGGSYGTYLGAVYTTLFPQRSDRIVLDSSLPRNGYDVTAFRDFALGLQDRFPDFAKFAAANPAYGLGATPEQVTAKYFDLAERLDAKPSAEGITGMTFRSLTFNALYSDLAMDYLAKSWHALDTDQPLPPAGGAVPTMTELDNEMSGNLSVVCNDSRWPRSIEAYQRAVEVDRARYPMLGGSTGNIKPCAFWPSPAEAPVRIGDQGPSTVLMVQNLRDPGTPLAGAKDLEQAFGDRARMVTVDHGGHGAYPFDLNTCANDAVTAFLTGGPRPDKDIACPAQPS